MSEINKAFHPIGKKIAVKFDSVSFSYQDFKVIENVSFHIHHGEFIAMVGPNGSGKTTILKLLFGLETPDAGNIEIFGVRCTDSKFKQMEGSLAYVPQLTPSDNMFPITVHDIVRMGLLRPLKGYSNEEGFGAEAVAEAMERTGISALAGKPYRALSGGQKRRTLVARALAARPDLLVLDEPTANMDSESEARLYEALSIYKGNTTIIIVTHDMEFVTSYTDRVLCLGDENRTVVQHRIEKNASAPHGGSHRREEARILHGENINADECIE